MVIIIPFRDWFNWHWVVLFARDDQTSHIWSFSKFDTGRFVYESIDWRSCGAESHLGRCIKFNVKASTCLEIIIKIDPKYPTSSNSPSLNKSKFPRSELINLIGSDFCRAQKHSDHLTEELDCENQHSIVFGTFRCVFTQTKKCWSEALWSGLWLGVINTLKEIC